MGDGCCDIIAIEEPKLTVTILLALFGSLWLSLARIRRAAKALYTFDRLVDVAIAFTFSLRQGNISR